MCAHVALADRKISDAAKVQLERGEVLFRLKDYAGAIEAFEAGYVLDAQPIFLYDKAQAQRLSGNCRAAIETYKVFLATDPPANEATRARKNIANCEAQLPPVVEPKPELDTELAPVEEDKREQPIASVQREDRAWWGDGIGMTLLTTGVISLGVGVGFAVSAQAAADDTNLAVDTTQWSAAYERWSRDRLIAGVALGAGATLVVSGVLRLSLRDRSVAVTPTGSHGAMVSLGGAW
jgi:tetratricopeptide (TPR) repeat protein